MLHNRRMSASTAPYTEPAGDPPCAGCAALEQDGAVVTLLSGHVVCRHCHAWRDECRQRQQEAIDVLAMGSKEARQAHLARVEQERGAEARKRLEDVILSTWEARREWGTRSTKG